MFKVMWYKLISSFLWHASFMYPFMDLSPLWHVLKLGTFLTTSAASSLASRVLDSYGQSHSWLATPGMLCPSGSSCFWMQDFPLSVWPFSYYRLLDSSIARTYLSKFSLGSQAKKLSLTHAPPSLVTHHPTVVIAASCLPQTLSTQDWFSLYTFHSVGS